jgi:hypothetical protein
MSIGRFEPGGIATPNLANPHLMARLHHALLLTSPLNEETPQ